MATSMYKSLLQPDLRLSLRENDAEALRAFCLTLYPGLVAEIMADMEATDIWRVLTHSDPPKQAEIFQFFSLPDQEHLVDFIDRPSLSRMIEEMASDDRADLLGRMDQEHVDALLPLIAQAERNDIKKLLAYPESSAGSIMTTEYASLPADITAGEAINRLRLQAPSRETIYYVYIVDEDRHLIGFLSLRRLIQAKPQTKVGELMDRDVIQVQVDADREVVANDMLRLAFLAMPVVDDEGRLVGIITHDDAAAVLQEEATEDAHRLAAVQPFEDGYLETPLLTLSWKRGIWLVILLGAAFLTATVLRWLHPAEGGTNAAEVAAFAWMVLFIPMVLASGGNAGSQSATLIIRMLAVEESRGETVGLFRKVLWHEIRLGLLLGLAVGVLAFCVALALVTAEQARVVGFTVFLVVGLGAVTGALLPLVLRKLKLDPALMSNPLMASLVDVLGVVIYFQMAKLLLSVHT